MKIKEVIVVEGKHDSDAIKACVECDTIETQGTHVSKQTVALIKKIQKQRGIIIFTDPDSPGEKIRQTINLEVPGCKNAFIDKKRAHTSKKVGVEHAQANDIKEALVHLMSFDSEPRTSLSYEEFIDLGFCGQNNSSKLREEVGNALFIGKANAKTLWKRLNMLGLCKQDIIEVLNENQNGDNQRG